MKNILYTIIGSIFCGITLSIILIYINLFAYGCDFLFFLKNILKNFEFYLFIPGIYLIVKDRFHK